MTVDRRGAVADALIAAAMIVVPLVSSSAFADQYTTVKWYVVHGVAAARPAVSAPIGRFLVRLWPGFRSC